MRLIILGPPGSGRETVAEVLAADMCIPMITARDTFQSGVRANTPAAVEAMRLMRTGHLVPKRVGLALLRDRLTRPDAATGFVLDGFPSHAGLPEAIDVMLADVGATVDLVVDLVLPDAEVVRRIVGRHVCRGCSRRWSADDAVPGREVCDGCGGEIFQRPDDDADLVADQLRSYRAHMAHVVDHYQSLGRLICVDAALPSTEIAARVLA